MIRQSLMPKEMLRDWKVQPIGGIFGDSAEGKKGPQRCFEKRVHGDSCKRQKAIPIDIMESVVEPYSQRVYNEDIN
ncbi:MAG: hypothetical protein GY814_02585 [Gammaproteobacteria bacterium]|nr:hypothetical protein [Gammaproteobacteria bacterium]